MKVERQHNGLQSQVCSLRVMQDNPQSIHQSLIYTSLYHLSKILILKVQKIHTTCSVIQKYIEGSLQLPNTKVKHQLPFILDIIYVTCLAHVIFVLLTPDLTFCIYDSFSVFAHDISPTWNIHCYFSKSIFHSIVQMRSSQ